MNIIEKRKITFKLLRIHLWYCCYVSVIVIVCLLLFDRIILPSLGILQFSYCSEYEIKNNEIINFNNQKKIQMNAVWCTKMHRVSPEKHEFLRILVLGDSFIWGDGYANMNDLWWRQLQIELLKRGYKDIEVIAAGKNGWSTRAQLNHITDSVIPIYKPDIVIWGYCTNDPDERHIELANDQWANYVSDLESGDVMTGLINRLDRFFPASSKLLKQYRRNKLALENPPPEEYGYSYTQWELELLKGENIKSYRKTIKDVQIYMDSINIPYFFVTLPNMPSRYYFNKRYKPIFNIFDNQKIPYYDLLPGFIKKYGILKSFVHTWGVNPANGHPGFRSTSFYAHQVAGILENDFSKILPSVVDTSEILNKYNINDWVPITMDVVQDGNSLTFEYPDDDSLMPKHPGNYSYVQFNLEFPVKISEIKISGKNLSSAKLSVTYNEINGQSVHEFGYKKGKHLFWKIKISGIHMPIRTIRINADFITNGQKIIKKALAMETVILK